jgi:hypothetical protein
MMPSAPLFVAVSRALLLAGAGIVPFTVLPSEYFASNVPVASPL